MESRNVGAERDPTLGVPCRLADPTRRRIVRVRREAQRRIYAIDGTGLAEVDAWLARTRSFWTARLDALEHVLDEAPSPEDSSPDE